MQGALIQPWRAPAIGKPALRKVPAIARVAEEHGTEHGTERLRSATINRWIIVWWTTRWKIREDQCDGALRRGPLRWGGVGDALSGLLAKNTKWRRVAGRNHGRRGAHHFLTWISLSASPVVVTGSCLSFRGDGSQLSRGSDGRTTGLHLGTRRIGGAPGGRRGGKPGFGELTVCSVVLCQGRRLALAAHPLKFSGHERRRRVEGMSRPSACSDAQTEDVVEEAGRADYLGAG